ncbi:DNA-directed RNA polymerase III subunit RPC6-like isoform X1 [Amphibalanus amphitrite]|uniref:DNA-directed RNA polymerase III subunit RPC6-like isoform X1 n=2 Tax=Amphibalanus amphitrite TaxID=1232801 RepID=UPI001C8FBE3F|nr:DNA-directed RNA polymerase III subunit RPC6-like isoform X1 [Amphibalanus amphitrite]
MQRRARRYIHTKLIPSFDGLLGVMASSSAAKDTEAALGPVEERILELCRTYPKGISDKIIQNDNPELEQKERVQAVNNLLAAGHIDLFKQGSELIYRLKGTSRARGGDAEEKIVYGIIEEAGNKGIWIRDIRFKSNLGMTQLNKLLKTMEGKKLIKSVTSVAASRKKVYMLYDIEPDQSVTGGAWYSDQDFESEFVEVLNQQCYKFLQQRAEQAAASSDGPMAVRNLSCASSKEIAQYISELGISKVNLSVPDIEKILDTLIYDGKVERRLQAGGGVQEQLKLYRATQTLLPPVGLVKTPCGICPVIDQCSDVGSVTPKHCLYLKDWLE